MGFDTIRSFRQPTELAEDLRTYLSKNKMDDYGLISTKLNLIHNERTGCHK